MSTRTAPINITSSLEIMVREVLLEDNTSLTIELRPGQLVIDVLRERGIRQDFIEEPGGLRTIRY